MKIDRKDLMVAALLAGLTIVAFWPDADCQFINYDDTLYVTSNSEVQQGLSWHGVSWAMTATDA
ncbi:MAG TPA: hypothetical protein VLZ81_13310, partial [Blastocatellia bacterium]|nr:hypothetical protein [Blastocatellia bacterium]